jgi:hypothetical protein
VETQAEGYQAKMPSISRHKCAISNCRHTWFTCNSKCRMDNGHGKRRFNTDCIYQTGKAAKRHHDSCHVLNEVHVGIDAHSMDIEDCDDAFIEDRVLTHVDGGMAHSSDDCVFEDHQTL